MREMSGVAQCSMSVLMKEKAILKPSKFGDDLDDALITKNVAVIKLQRYHEGFNYENDPRILS